MPKISKTMAESIEFETKAILEMLDALYPQRDVLGLPPEADRIYVAVYSINHELDNADTMED